MKKRILALLLAALCLCVPLCSCSVQNSTTTTVRGTAADEDVLYGHGLELAELLEEMLSAPEYFQLMTASDEVNQIIIPLMRTDFSEPGSVYLITLAEDTLPLLMESSTKLGDLPESLQNLLLHRMQSSVPTILNSFAGTETLAASTLCTASDIYVGETLEQGCYMLYFYPDACPVIVSFYPGEGYVEATATLLLGEPLEEDSLEAVSELFQDLKSEGVGIHVKKLDLKPD